MIEIPPQCWRANTDNLAREYPRITPGAAKFLDKYLNSSHRVLDLGTGGSTLFYARRGKFVTGIETVESWLNPGTRRTGH